MADDQISYAKVRAVRDETGASHQECRRALEETGGDVAAAAALWFARKGTAGRPAPNGLAQTHLESERN